MKEYINAQTKTNALVTGNSIGTDELHRFSHSDFRWADNKGKSFQHRQVLKGEAKGVLLSTYSINAIAEQFRGLTGGFQAGDTWLTLSVPFVAYAMICSLHLPLSLRMNCMIELYGVPQMAKSIIKKKIKHVSATPLLYAKLLDMVGTKEQDLSFLEMPISGGDKLNAALYQKVNQLFNRNGCKWNVCSGYGMTEVSSAASVSHRGCSNKAGSSGIPFPNTIISAFDPETNEEPLTSYLHNLIPFQFVQWLALNS